MPEMMAKSEGCVPAQKAWAGLPLITVPYMATRVDVSEEGTALTWVLI